MEDKELQRSYYAIIPANVRYDKDLTPNAKLLYGEITALCNERGYCWATNEYFSDLYGVSKISISKWVNNLVQKGYITSELIYKEGTKQIENRYLRIVSEPIKEKFNTPIKEKSNTPIEDKFKDNNTDFNNTNNNNTTNKDKKESKSKANSFDSLIEEYSNGNEEIKALLGDWLKVRKAKRAAMTDRAIQLNLEKLDRLAAESGLSVADYLKEVICRGWQAFFKINNYNQPQKQGSGILDDFNRMEEKIKNGDLF